MDAPVLTNGMLRDLVIVALFLGALYVGYRRTTPAPATPPAVTPITQPIEEQVRQVKHDVQNIQQWGMRHEDRLRIVEMSVAEIRGGLTTLIDGQQRISRHLDMLLAHHMPPEDRK